MRTRRRPFITATIAVMAMGAPVAVLTTISAPAGAATSTVNLTGTGHMRTTGPGAPGIQFPELRDSGSEPDARLAKVHGSLVNRRLSSPSAAAPTVAGVGRSAAGGPARSFDGINHFDQRFATGGNQFSSEPPDQGLCAGGGYVLEVVNSAVRVFKRDGTALTPTIGLNEFYGFPPAIDRTTGVFGPDTFDPMCHYDGDTNRWFVVTDDLARDSDTGDLTGANSLDIAVSKTADPTGDWNVYRLPQQNDGTEGTPNHHCEGGPCFGDYPHLGADAYGIYLTTNEYDLFGPNFESANIYAFSKQALARGDKKVGVVRMQTKAMAAGNPGFTVWPAISQPGDHATAAGGTEFFLSSDAAGEAGGMGTSNRIFVWSLTNTKSLATAKPALTLRAKAIGSELYSVPGKAYQPDGPLPLADCLNDTRLKTPDGPGCWRVFFDAADEPPHHQGRAFLDTNDSRMQQVTYAGGMLYGALDTGTYDASLVPHAGIAWFVVKPTATGSSLSGSMANQGYLAVSESDIAYPSVGVLPNGKGVMSFTLSSAEDYPSQAYVPLSASGLGDVVMAAAGKGPQDGFTGYEPIAGAPVRPRWGDYGATAVDGDSIWLANEYIGQSCSLAQYAGGAAFGVCNNTRSAFANWGTRISQVKP